MLTPRQAQSVVSGLSEAARIAASGYDAANGEVLQSGLWPVPEEIGGYMVRGLIASGGMGTVYEAEQSNPRRKVAVKVMNREAMSRTALRRFQYEVEVLAKLQHPGIAQIYEAGTHDDGNGGVPYFAMEYILDAMPINGYADEQGLDLESRLELFAQACEAVDYGHQNRIIHRDLKPANILVDQRGAVKIIDFGIACTTDVDVTRSIRTDVRTILGTLQYMSPEQATGGWTQHHGDCVQLIPTVESELPPAFTLDTRTDIYSLGVVLYELACGQLPYNLSKSSVAHAASVIEQSDPPSPMSIWRQQGVRHLRRRRDLEAIILKAMEKDRRRRYQSASSFVDDVRRFLRGDPVDATPPSHWIRAVKWVGRHPIATSIAASVTIVGFTGVLTIIGVWWWNVQPARFRILEGQRTCYLESRAGRILTTLGGGQDKTGTVNFAVIADRPSHAGSGHVAIFSVVGSDGGHLTDGQLFVSPLYDLDRPYWTAGDDISTPEPFTWTNQQYSAKILMLADVFDTPELPGSEIVVAHFNDTLGSPCAIRIYDWQGRVLFEAWHLGPVFHMVWLPEPRLLVCAGDRHGIIWDKANAWVRDNQAPSLQSTLTQGDYPIILFAVQPQLGESLYWVDDRSTAHSRGGVAWYRCIHPLVQRGIVRSNATNARLELAIGDLVHHRESQLLFRLIGPAHSVDSGIGLVVALDGTLISRNLSDAYRRGEADGRIGIPSEAVKVGPLPDICETLDQTKERWVRDRPHGQP